MRPLLQRVVPRPCASARAGHDRGSATIQFTVLMPVLFLLIFVGIQGAVQYHARTVALAAAQEGARAAAAQFGTPAAGRAAAEAFVVSAGGDDTLQNVAITTSRDLNTARVVVSGTSLSLVPGWTPVITQSASAPVERITG